MTRKKPYVLAEHEGFINISVEEALQILKTAPWRLTEKSGGSWYVDENYTVTEPQIKHQGVWKDVCRTDDTDNECTHYETHKPLEEWQEEYIERTRLGARYNDRLFAVVDRYSDG